MPYITRISTAELRGISPLEITLEPPEGRPFRHLVLTGPNGTGKTTILGAIAGQVWEDLARDPIPPLRYVHSPGRAPADRIKDLSFGKVQLGWAADPSKLQQDFARGQLVACYLPARRGIEIEPVDTIAAERTMAWTPVEAATPKLLQFLVDRKAQQSFARDDGDAATAHRMEGWFTHLERSLARLFGEDELRLEFDRKSLTFHIATGSQRYNLLELAHGHAAAIGILSEVLMRVELSRDDSERSHDRGVVLIDEPEMHLHLELQERILPALVEMFPQIQFIIATHSPVVVSSIDDAIVFDLEDRKPRRSEDLRGRPYGWIMKRHFGLEEDFDLATTELLHELDVLRRLESPTPAQHARLEQLAEQLSGTSHALALEVWNRVLTSRLERREAHGEVGE